MHALPEFTLRRPATLSEAAALLASEPQPVWWRRHRLVPNLRRGLERPTTLIDLSGLNDFSDVQAHADGGLTLAPA